MKRKLAGGKVMGESDFDDILNSESNGKNPNAHSGNDAISISTVNDYVFVEEAYKGNGGFKSGKYLIPHNREAFYPTRREFSGYTNFINPILQAMVDPVFNQDVKRDYQKNELFEAFLEDVNYNNLKIQEFSKMVTKYVRLHSVSFIVMDYILEDGDYTEKELLERDIHPYVYMRKAQDVDSYKLDFFGRLNEIVFFDKMEEFVVKGKKVEKQTYIRWTSDKWEKLIKEKDKYVVVETRDLETKEIPVSVIYEDAREDTGELLTETKFYSLCKINHTIYNQDSEKRELQRNQAFSLLYIQEDENNTAGRSIGTTNYLKVDMEANIPPAFIQPDPNLLKELQEQREKAKADLFTLADQLGVIGVTKQAKSGLALVYEFSAYEATLQKTATIAIRVEAEIARLYELYTNTNLEYEADYNTEYTVGKEETKITMYDTVKSWGDVPPELNTLIYLDTIKTLFPEIDEAEFEVIETMIKDRTVEPELENDKDETDLEGKGNVEEGGDE